MRNLKSHLSPWILIPYWLSQMWLASLMTWKTPPPLRMTAFQTNMGPRHWTCLWAWLMAWWSRVGGAPEWGLDHGKGQNIIKLTQARELGGVRGDKSDSLFSTTLEYYLVLILCLGAHQQRLNFPWRKFIIWINFTWKWFKIIKCPVFNRIWKWLWFGGGFPFYNCHHILGLKCECEKKCECDSWHVERFIQNQSEPNVLIVD